VNIKRKKEKPGKEASTSTGTSTNNGKMEAPAPRKAKNTSVYVKGLPADTTHDELVDRFRKFGVLEEDDEGEPKIKLYAREDGVFSGDALVVYFKEESVTLACTMLDDAELRIGQSSTRMSVAQADFSHKNDGAIKAEGSDGPKPRKTIDKKKATRRITNMKKWVVSRTNFLQRDSHGLRRKLEEWDDEDNFGPAKTAEDDVPVINKNGRVVVLKYMFTAKEIEEDASLLLDLKDEVREECETLGEVTNVVLYDVSDLSYSSLLRSC
jgi:HIV Tat-specific factor 1